MPTLLFIGRKLRSHLALLLSFACASFECGDPRPSDGQPCDGPGHQCGAGDLGIECRDGTWRTLCARCEDGGDVINCLFNVCVATNPSQCDLKANHRTITCHYPKDGTTPMTEVCSN